MNQVPGCLDYQLKPTNHEAIECGQRYLSATTGKCKRLRVQSVNPRRSSTGPYDTRNISSKVSFVTRLSATLIRMPNNVWEVIIFPFEWILFHVLSVFLFFIIFLSLLTGYGHVERRKYKPYIGMYWGQFWAPRSEREYSKHKANLELRPADQLQLPPLSTLINRIKDPTEVLDHVVRAMSPRQLIRLVDDQWTAVTEGSSEQNNFFLATAKYMAVSYCQTDFPDKHILIQIIRNICETRGWEAYWLDIECTGVARACGQNDNVQSGMSSSLKKQKGKAVNRQTSSPLLLIAGTTTREQDNIKGGSIKLLPDADKKIKRDMKNHDLFRMADVFRGAEETLIMIKKRNTDSTSDIDTSSADYTNGWLCWGSRVWTFPEALLSKNLVYHIGDDEIRSVTLRQLANIAFPDRDEAVSIIDGYSGKDRLSRLELLSMLKDAIWKRSSGPALPPTSSVPHSGFISFPAEKVYALMGLFEHRIMPDSLETETQALARLSMVNDSNRIIERMAAMLPSSIPDRACWYADDDKYGARLWDIEPDVTAAGLTESGAIVLDGCHAAAIRWKGFPKIHFKRKRGFRRSLAILVARFAVFLFTGGLICVMFSYWLCINLILGVGIALLVLGGFLMLAAPYLLMYGNSGRVIMSDSWLIGVEGVLAPSDIEYYLYGTRPFGSSPCKIRQSPTGSPLAKPDMGRIRIGAPADQEAREVESKLKNSAEQIFTLVDTVCNTVYYFVAKRPPTVCLYVGREGGLGRYILCSENCRLNELHKETVLRMPTYVRSHMSPCDWVAVGSHPSIGCEFLVVE